MNFPSQSHASTTLMTLSPQASWQILPRICVLLALKHGNQSSPVRNTHLLLDPHSPVSLQLALLQAHNLSCRPHPEVSSSWKPSSQPLCHSVQYCPGLGFLKQSGEWFESPPTEDEEVGMLIIPNLLSTCIKISHCTPKYIQLLCTNQKMFNV